MSFIVCLAYSNNLCGVQSYVHKVHASIFHIFTVEYICPLVTLSFGNSIDRNNYDEPHNYLILSIVNLVPMLDLSVFLLIFPKKVD